MRAHNLAGVMLYISIVDFLDKQHNPCELLQRLSNHAVHQEFNRSLQDKHAHLTAMPVALLSLFLF